MKKVFILILLFANNCYSQIYPFDYSNSWMFIKLKVNDSIEGNFIFDTGAPLAVLDWEFVKRNNIKTDQGSFQIDGIGDGGGHSTGFIKQLKFKYQDLSQTFRAISVIDLKKHVTKDNIDGIVGFHFFEKQAVEFDFENNRFIIHNNSFNPTENGFIPASINTNMNRREIFYKIKININDSLTIKDILVFDTGNTSSISLDAQYAEKHNLSSLQTVASTISYNTGIGGGISKDNYLYSKYIDLNNTKLHNVLIDYSLNKKVLFNPAAYKKYLPIGMLGMKVISKFNWFFDFKNQKFYLKPNKNSIQPYTFSLYNIYFNVYRDGFSFVRKINKNSSDKYGINAGDTIQSICTLNKINIPISNLIENPEKWSDSLLYITIFTQNKTVTKQFVLKKQIFKNN